MMKMMLKMMRMLLKIRLHQADEEDNDDGVCDSGDKDP